MRALLIAAILLVPPLSWTQSDDAAQRVYRSSQDSVFLVYLNDSSGNPTALGSAFVVAPHTLITNAHVVDAGSPVLAVGPVRIPVRVLSKDDKNDLAVLSVDVNLTSAALPIAADTVTPGERIFAIGNPEGLEKTISEGIISGIRTIGDRSLLQITSPISHGSSGGPILDQNGRVVGVAVSMLADGQNLNFAVPAQYVRNLLEKKTSDLSPTAPIGHTADDAVALESKKSADQYSEDDGSPFQRDSKELAVVMHSAVDRANAERDLAKLACVGAKDTDVIEDAIRAARKLAEQYPSPDTKALLAFAIYRRADSEYFASIFAKDDSPEKLTHKSNQMRYLAEAESEASKAIEDAKSHRPAVALYVLASVDEDRQNYSAASQLFQAVLPSRAHACEVDLTESSLKSLISDSEKLNRHDEAERWFRQFTSEYTPEPYDWDNEGDRRQAVQDYAGTADAYERAAAANAYYVTDYCYAAVNRYFQPKTDGDKVLDDGRKCVEAASQNTDEHKAKTYDREVPVIYRLMASVLNDRGVYETALGYIKQSLNKNPGDSLALHVEASIYENLGEYSGGCPR